MGTYLRSFLILSALILPLAAHADTILTFVASGNHVLPKSPGISFGPPVSGTVTIDVTIGQVLSVDFTAPPNSVSIGTSVGVSPSYTELFEAFNFSNRNGNFTAIDFVLPVTSFVGYTGGYICSQAHPCAGVDSIYNRGLINQIFTDGALSLTPEPSTLLMLATGLLGLAGILGKRLVATTASKPC